MPAASWHRQHRRGRQPSIDFRITHGYGRAMSIWIAILVVCATADDCTIAYSGDQVSSWPTEAECNAIAAGMLSGARQAGQAPLHVVTAGCVEILIPSPSDPA